MKHVLETPVLESLLLPVVSTLNKEAAKKLLTLKANKKVQAKVDRLAKKCNEGTLTPDERSEYQTIVNANSILSILKAKARFLVSQESKWNLPSVIWFGIEQIIVANIACCTKIIQPCRFMLNMSYLSSTAAQRMNPTWLRVAMNAMRKRDRIFRAG